MLAIKINNKKENRDSTFKKSIQNIVSYVHKKITGKTKLISDNDSVEIILGQEEVPGEDQIVAELLIRKTIVINNKDFNDKRELDKFLKQIRHFCEQAKVIEEANYSPLELNK